MRTDPDIKPVTYMKTRAAQLLRAVETTHRPVIITQNGEPKGVVMDFQSYQELKQAALILKLVAQAEAEVRAGQVDSQRQVFADMKRLLRRQRRE